MYGKEQGSDVSLELVFDSDLTRRFITQYHLDLLALQAHGADEVNVDRRINDELQRQLQIAKE